MKVAAVELFHVRLPFKGSFAHASKARTEAEAVLVKMRSERGAIGWGEIVPRTYLTGESIESVWEESAPLRARAAIGRSMGRDDARAFLEGELAHAGRRLATNAGFELAYLDAAGKEHGFRATDVIADRLGPELPAGVVIGFEVKTDALAKHCALLRMAGKEHVKVKVGADDDLARLEIIAQRLQVPLRIDANEAWSTDEAIAKLNAMKHIAITSIEQPVKGGDLDGLRKVREATGMKVMADESLASSEDAALLIARHAADVFNVRVGKCGGLIGSKRIADIGLKAGLTLHLGALVGETGILSRAGELFGRAVPAFDCLEGKGQNKFLLAADVVGSEASGEDFRGLGLEINEEKVRAHLVASAAY